MDINAPTPIFSVDFHHLGGQVWRLATGGGDNTVKASVTGSSSSLVMYSWMLTVIELFPIISHFRLFLVIMSFTL